MISLSDKKELINKLIGEGLLLSPTMLSKLDAEELQQLTANIENKPILVINQEVKSLLSKKNTAEINWQEIEKTSVLKEKNKEEAYKQLLAALNLKTEKKKKEGNEFEVVREYPENTKKRDVSDFTNYFNARYNQLEKIIRARPEIGSNLLSISRILSKRDKGPVSLIGLVTEKDVTKNKNILLKIEDTTAEINVIVSKNKPELFELAQNTVEDEVVGVTGANSGKVIFANNIVFPDVPTTHELKKTPYEEYAVFLSDLHVGSSYFLENEFKQFLKWVNGNAGNEEQKKMSEKLKYIFIAGDLVDGVGIYPEQDKELTIPDIYEQYEECGRLLSQIPQEKRIIICPGNHDAVRIAEPQPRIPKDIAKPLYDIKNLTMVTNPAVIRIAKHKNFQGLDVLMYHGYSFDYYVANVESIRTRGGYERSDLIMKYILQKRHLAPTHMSTLYIPDPSHDPLVISDVPDLFVSGHIHRASISNYRNVTMISGSCWQSITNFQRKVGHKPEPARVPVVNLSTRETKMLKFIK